MDFDLKDGPKGPPGTSSAGEPKASEPHGPGVSSLPGKGLTVPGAGDDGD